MSDAIRHYPLTRYGVLRFAGPDARTFLQGQLSNDTALLSSDRPLLAGLHNPQGRVLALLRLWAEGDDPEGVLAAVPRELLAQVVTQLRRFVLRSKVMIADASSAWQLRGECDAQGQLRHRIYATSEATAVSAGGGLQDEAAWEAQEVVAGLPEIYTATSGEFVAQMLNLDYLGAIAWTKGCYTGQEIIARTHYRGQVKRRMRRYVAAAAAPPAPGSAWTTQDGLAVRVVRSARAADGHCELLGVAPLDSASVDERPLPYAAPRC